MSSKAFTAYLGNSTSDEKHIEYNINSFTGCSRAVVFLLDKGQPEDSVQECDYAGAYPTLGERNLAS